MKVMKTKKCMYKCSHCGSIYLEKRKFIRHKWDEHFEAMSELSMTRSQSSSTSRKSSSSSSYRSGGSVSLFSVRTATPVPPSPTSSGEETYVSTGSDSDGDAVLERTDVSESNVKNVQPAAVRFLPRHTSTPVPVRASSKRKHSPATAANTNATCPTVPATNKRSGINYTDVSGKDEKARPCRYRVPAFVVSRSERTPVPVPYGQPVVTLGTDGTSKVEFLRNPKTKGG